MGFRDESVPEHRPKTEYLIDKYSILSSPHRGSTTVADEFIVNAVKRRRYQLLVALTPSESASSIDGVDEIQSIDVYENISSEAGPDGRRQIKTLSAV